MNCQKFALRLVPVLIATLFGLAILARSPQVLAQEKLGFNAHIRAILSDKCFQCHGFDGAKREAGLRLDTPEGATGKLESGAVAIVPGQSQASELVKRILTTDPDLKMPPPGTGKTLSESEIATLRRWIDEGAPYQQHWSFTPIERPALPPLAETAGAPNAIDAFVRDRLRHDGLAPAPEADKTTLLRRVTLDLTGLPPTLAELDAFLADTSPDAYARVVTRLLESPRYGEHMARYWLDVARYGDTHGLHFDNERSMWLYRDWVVNAFNTNQPFDQFTVEQLAGDLLPNATQEQRIATGFNRCNVSTSEGGSIDEEVLVRYAIDRTETVATAWLGLTLGCAVCHSHKFDPITQTEFYQLYAFYRSTADAAMDGNSLTPPPVMKAATREQSSGISALEAKLGELRTQLTEQIAKIEYVDPGVPAGEKLNEPSEYVWIDEAAPAGAQLQGNSAWEFVEAPQPVLSGQKSHRRQAEGLSQHFFTGANPGLKVGEGDKLFAYVYLDPANPPKTVMLQWNDGAWEHRAFWGDDLIAFGAGDTPGHRALGPLPKAGEWVRLEVAAQHVGLAAGAVINGWAFTQFGGHCHWDKAGMVTRTPQDDQSFASQQAWEEFERGLGKSTLPGPVKAAVKKEAAARSPDETRLVRSHFLEHVHASTVALLAPHKAAIAKLEQEKQALEGTVPSTLVMAEMPKPREAFVLKRGEYDHRADKVTPGVPAVLPPLPAGIPANRLALAKWLVDRRHPLTARVTVNRFWQQYFGRGLVKTSEDFGSQGERPTHPELLDFLAAEFIESGWNVKKLQELIVLSATYRQSSRATRELLERDPENALLARGARFRTDAEVVRDTALFVSGLLVDKPGGRGVRPYQPDGIWEAVAFRGSNTENYRRDTGESLYRRSLYTFWKRTAPPAGLCTFDAPSRENSIARRPRTNTPLQALALMNDEQYVEASRMFAERMLLNGGGTPGERLAFGFRLATSRLPAPDELAVLERVLQQQLARYRTPGEAAKKLLAVGEAKRHEALDPAEHAAYTLVANLILNLDETITKE